jgi:hypothetical protein
MFCSAGPVPQGLAPEMPKGQRFTFTIEPDLYEPLRAQAKKERRSVGSLLNWLAAQYLEERQGVEIEQKVQHGGDRKSKRVADDDQAPEAIDTN